MTQNLPARAIPTPTPQIAKGLSPDQLAEHRDGIYSEVDAVLSAYPQRNDAPEIRAINRAWWCDELQDWTREQVVYALRKWNRDSPDWKPTPGNILRILKETRGQRAAERSKASVAEVAEVATPRVSPEAAAEIMAAAGFRVQRTPEAQATKDAEQ